MRVKDFIFLTTIMFVIVSCKNEKFDLCKSVISPIEFDFPLSDLRDFTLFTNNKIIIQDRKDYNKPVFWEVDTESRRISKMDSLKNNLYFDHSEIDRYDSLIWIGGANISLELYDQRTKSKKELPVKYVNHIITKPNEVFLVSFYGLFVWNRKLQSLNKIKSIPTKYIQLIKMIGDSIIILDEKYTYNLNTKTGEDGIYFGDFQFHGSIHDIEVIDNFIFFLLDDRLWYIHKGKREMIPLPYNYLNSTKVFDNKIWQRDEEKLYSYDPKTQLIKKYSYRLPMIPPNTMKTASLDFIVDQNTIWIHQSGQIMLVDILTQKHFYFPEKDLQNHIQTLIDDCNVFLLYKNKFKIYPKAEFISKCKPFDVKTFVDHLARYKTMVDSLGFSRDTSSSSVLAKLNFLKSKYKNSTHVEIIEHLSGMDTYAFQNIEYEFPNEFIECYKDQRIPLDQRENCINRLAFLYILNSSFKKALALENESKKYGLNAKSKNVYSFNRNFEAARKHISSIDSLSKIYTAKDSFSFYSILQLKTLARDIEMYYGLESYYHGLSTFSQIYPESNLIDDAAHELLGNFEYTDDDSNEYWIWFINEMEIFLNQYPKSEFIADVQYNIFEKWTYVEPINSKKLKEAGVRFIQNFTDDKRASDVKKTLKYYQIK